MPVDPGHDRCERCLFQRRVCLCSEIPTVPTRTHVVIVRHHLEQWRSSNTGRLAHFALPNSTLLDHGGSLGPATLPPMDGAWLVFPEGEPFDPETRSLAEPPRQLVFLDATWSQARRMFRKLDGLRGVPLLRLADVGTPTLRLRESPEPGKLSTIEAIAAALRLFEGDSVATPLETLFQVAVGRAAASGRNIAKPS